MSQVFMPPSSESEEPEEPAVSPGVTVAAEQANADAHDEARAEAAGTWDSSRAQSAALPSEQQVTGHVTVFPPQQPISTPMPQQAPTPWPQQPAQFQWPQQYPQPQMPQQPPQPPYPYAYPQPAQAVQPGQPYAGQAQPNAVWPQPVQAPPYPGYPQPFPPQSQPGMAQPGMAQPGMWPYPYAQPGYAPPGNPQPAYVQPLVTAPLARTVVESGRTVGWQGYEKPQQAAIWKVIKWPIKTLLKGIYVTGSAAKRHRAVAIVLLLVITLLAGGSYAVYQATHPAPASTASSTSASGGQPDITPFTIVTGAQPPLSSGVITFLHGYKTFDGYQLWNSLSPGLQQNLQANGVSAAQLNSDLQQEKNAGITYSEFIYTGGFLSPDGTSHYTVEVVEALGNARSVRTWFFMTDTNDKVIDFQDLSPQPGQGG